jgi:hypothetical protein
MSNIMLADSIPLHRWSQMREIDAAQQAVLLRSGQSGLNKQQQAVNGSRS